MVKIRKLLNYLAKKQMIWKVDAIILCVIENIRIYKHKLKYIRISKIVYIFKYHYKLQHLLIKII
jgi:hypothetical protein